MGFAMRIMSAAARLFGPKSKNADNIRQIGKAGIAAALIALGAKLAKADGIVSSEEVRAFKTVFKIDKNAMPDIERFYNLAKQTTLGYQYYGRIVFRHYKNRPDILEDILDGLFFIALSDGIVTASEMQFLETIAKIFKFSPLTFARIKAIHCGRSPDDPYLVLGVDESISDAGLKKIYHAMAAANHPDRLAARGLPPEMQKLATAKMAMINKAYAEIMEIRKHKPVWQKLEKYQRVCKPGSVLK